MAPVVVIGGSDAGISAALRAREVDPGVAITVVVADRYPNYSICGLPYFLSGEVPDWRQLAHRSVAEIEGQGITLRLDHAAQAIDPSGKVVTLRDSAGSARELAYDRLVIATGAVPREPPIAGLRQDGVFLLHTMGDSLALQRRLAADPPRSAIIVGGGYLGLEMADALTLRGIAITLLQRGPSVLNTVDASFGERIVAELRRHGVEVVTGVAVEAIARAGSRLVVRSDSTTYGPADLVLVAAGVQPATEVARTAGVALGAHGAIRVTRAMETSLPDIYAAGDCVETWHRLLERPTYLPLGTTAHKQGRVAGENAVGGRRQFAGSVGTQVVKVFDLAIARTGLLEAEALAAGFEPLTVETTAWDHKVYYPGARELRLRITGDRQSGRLLGAQIVGHWQSEVAKRIDIFATALYHTMAVDDLNALDLSYTPPVSSPWDPVQMGAQVWVRAGIETQAYVIRGPFSLVGQEIRMTAEGPGAADAAATMRERVLFLCTHNSSRSQMAEGLLRARGGDRYAVFSAGTHPRGVHPLAIQVMSEIGIDISEAAGHRAKGIDAFTGQPPMDLVVTVCDEAAEECPLFPGARRQEHWGFPDPSAATGTEEERLAVFRQVRDAIAARIDLFLRQSSVG